MKTIRKICVMCGKDFYVYPCRDRDRPCLTCSPKCRDKRKVLLHRHNLIVKLPVCMMYSVEAYRLDMQNWLDDPELFCEDCTETTCSYQPGECPYLLELKQEMERTSHVVA
jgi:hypothetical protein